MELSTTKTLFGKRRGFILFSLVLLCFCINLTDIKWADFKLNHYGVNAATEFFKAAFNPAFDYPNKEELPSTIPPYYEKIIKAAWVTVKYATCGFSLAIPIGIFMGFFASRSWWQFTRSKWIPRATAQLLHRFVRILITAGRSIHELLWGLLFISAIGTTPFSIIAAIAIPYGCTLAKVFSEILDEQESNCRDQIRLQGGSPFSSWLFGVVPLAFNDILSYALYRYECAIRSAAIFGFVGIPTLGYHIEAAAAEGIGYYGEIWTLLYVLLGIILVVERLSCFARKKLNSPQQSKHPHRSLEQLTKYRPKRFYLKFFTAFSVLLFIFVWNHQTLIPATQWLDDESMMSNLSFQQRWENFTRFLDKELTPSTVRNSGDWSQAFPWAKELFLSKGIAASLQTFYIATSAMILAWLSAICVIPWASKVLNSPQPFGVHKGNSRLHAFIRGAVALFLRFIFIISRSMPEYLLAFLLLVIFPPSAWPLIVALAIHNFGIVGRLGWELVDNRDFNHAKIPLLQGGSRAHSYFFSLLPTHFNRFLLYFFYRWETCVRDATILGMLSIASIGLEIKEAQARDRLDELFFFILLGAAIVMIGDLISDTVRSRIKETQ